MSHRSRIQQNLTKLRRQGSLNNPSLSALPLCDLEVCLTPLRPLSSLRENVVLSNLVSRFGEGTRDSVPAASLPSQSETQFHILINCTSTNNTPLPHCFSRVVFATAFIDEILEQQAQSNLVVLRWPGAREGMGIAGRLMRPDIYH